MRNSGGIFRRDWARDLTDIQFPGYAFRMGKGAVTWSSKKQVIVALSKHGSRIYCSNLFTRLKSLFGPRTFLGELTTPFSGPITLHCDNQGAIALSKDNKFHARTKHIDIRYHFIREAVENNEVFTHYVPTDENVAYIFTKPLAMPNPEKFVTVLDLVRLIGSVEYITSYQLFILFN